jgi:hypothetical protein
MQDPVSDLLQFYRYLSFRAIDTRESLAILDPVGRSIGLGGLMIWLSVKVLAILFAPIFLSAFLEGWRS